MLSVLAALAFSGCGKEPAGPATPARIDVVTGNDQTDSIEATLPIPLRVRVVDAGGRGVSGVSVTWNAGAAAGSIAPVTSTTDASGETQGSWTLGTVSGQQSVVATAAGQSVQFRATVRAGTPTAMEDLSGGGDTAVYGAVLPRLRLLRFVDRRGNAVAGASVQWSVTSGGGQLTPPSGTTDVDGRASSSWRLGDAPGANTASVTVAGATFGPLTATGIGYRSVALGLDHSCGLTVAGAAYCWGGNFATGALGDGTTIRRARPVAVIGGRTFASLAASAHSTCGLEPSGTVFCWGDNTDGQLGNGTAGGFVTAPTLAAGGLQFDALSMAEGHVCGLTALGAAYCWGSNRRGQLGDGTFSDRLTPVAVAGGLTFRAISASGTATCGITPASELFCWGQSAYWGNSPDLTSSPVAAPVPVASGMTFASVSVGGLHVCGLGTSGDGYCWGSGNNGQLGTGTLYETAPASVLAGSPLAALTAGHINTCAITTTGITHCWGYNGYSQVGDGTTIDRHTPQVVLGGRAFSSIDLGAYHACAIESSGVVYCWGSNGNGQLGDGNVNTVSASPVAVLPPL
jgi:alpha-tubulin suppressor-like RCC1 family protein